MSKYLHVFTDEKWTNITVEQFKNSKKANQNYVVLYDGVIKTPDYKLQHQLPIEKIGIGSKDYRALIKNLSNYSAIFIHFLCDKKLEIIEKTPKSTKLVWMCWGQDIHKMIIADSYMPKTRSLLLKKRLFNEYLWKYTLWMRQTKFKKTRRGRALQKFDYCCPVIPEDLNRTNRKFDLNIKILPYVYGSVEIFLGELINKSRTDENILIGNSSTYASNHLDVIDIIKDIDISGKKVIVPLNYGNIAYGNTIEEKGKEVFGNAFVGLREYLDPIEYSKVILSCSVGIFNHVRQQALGNIIMCLWLGIKVYLNEKGSLFKYLSSLGLTVYSVQNDLALAKNTIFIPITHQEHKRNLEIIKQHFSEENVNVLITNIFKTLEISHNQNKVSS